MNMVLGFWIDPYDFFHNVYEAEGNENRTHLTFAQNVLKVKDENPVEFLIKEGWIRVTSTDTFNLFKFNEGAKYSIKNFISKHPLAYENFSTVFIEELSRNREFLVPINSL
jgi:hypothetical protein